MSLQDCWSACIRRKFGPLAWVQRITWALSHNQNTVLKWSTQNHVKNEEGGRSYLWLGLSLTNFHLPGL